MRNKIERSGNRITGDMPYFIFKEGDKYVAYSPALELSTCGDTKEEARKMFSEAAQIFIDEVIKMGTLDDVLAECGWQKILPENTWSPPKYEQESIKITAGAGA